MSVADPDDDIDEYGRVRKVGITDENVTEAINQCAVPVFAVKRTHGWPKHQRNGECDYLPLHEALTHKFATDAHFGAYFAPDKFGRLTKLGPDGRGAHERLARGVLMLVYVFDVDCPDVHGTDTPAPDRWRTNEALKIERLFACHRGGYAYGTRGGYRVLYRARAPVVIRTRFDDEDWTRGYRRRCCYLARQFDIVADPNCADWTRLYRLPHVVRE